MDAALNLPERSGGKRLPPSFPPELAVWEKNSDSLRPHPCASLLGHLAKRISGARVRWVGCQPQVRQRVYFANHTSHMDFLVIWAALPLPVRALARPVAARDYWTKSRLRHFLMTRLFRAILIERGCPKRPCTVEERADPARAVIEPLLKALEAGNSLIVFPEGTRGTGEQVGLFKSGFYYLCRSRPDVELVPVFLGSFHRILPKGEFFPVPVLSAVTFGSPLRWRADESKKAFLQRTRSSLCELRNV